MGLYKELSPCCVQHPASAINETSSTDGELASWQKLWVQVLIPSVASRSTTILDQ